MMSKGETDKEGGVPNWAVAMTEWKEVVRVAVVMKRIRIHNIKELAMIRQGYEH